MDPPAPRLIAGGQAAEIGSEAAAPHEGATPPMVTALPPHGERNRAFKASWQRIAQRPWPADDPRPLFLARRPTPAPTERHALPRIRADGAALASFLLGARPYAQSGAIRALSCNGNCPRMNMLLSFYLIVVALICFAAIPLAREGCAQIVSETSRSLVSAGGRPRASGIEKDTGRGRGALPLS